MRNPHSPSVYCCDDMVPVAGELLDVAPECLALRVLGLVDDLNDGPDVCHVQPQLPCQSGREGVGKSGFGVEPKLEFGNIVTCLNMGRKCDLQGTSSLQILSRRTRARAGPSITIKQEQD